MRSNELNADQLSELKQTFFYEEEHGYEFIHQIPDDVIIKHFEGIEFVNDDFGCSMGMEE